MSAACTASVSMRPSRAFRGLLISLSRTRCHRFRQVVSCVAALGRLSSSGMQCLQRGIGPYMHRMRDPARNPFWEGSPEGYGRPMVVNAPLN